MSDDHRHKFPVNEILLALYPGDRSTDPEGEAKLTVPQTEELVAQLLEFTRQSVDAAAT